jgi:hypothetical protein
MDFVYCFGIETFEQFFFCFELYNGLVELHDDAMLSRKRFFLMHGDESACRGSAVDDVDVIVFEVEGAVDGTDSESVQG